MRRTMKRREAIQLTLPPVAGRMTKIVYFAKPRQWDASWYTSDVNKAKVWRHPGMAAETIRSYGKAWDAFSPRVIDPRTIFEYVDVPSAAEKRHAQTDAVMKRIFKR